jgi:uncharacterized protein YbjT (DUF2867 family)
MLSMSEPVAVKDVGAAIVHALTMPLASHRVLTLPGPELVWDSLRVGVEERLLARVPCALAARGSVSGRR